MNDYDLLPDQELISLLVQGDQRAFNEIYNRFRGLLYIYACKLVKDKDEAEDLVQDVFISLWDKRSSLDLRRMLSSYLYTAVKYKFLDLVAHRRVRLDYAASFQAFMEEGINLTEEYIIEKELAEFVEKEVANLPEKMRKVFTLSRTEGLSHREIALTLDLSEKTVKNQVNNSLKVLRSKIGQVNFFLFILP